MIGTLTDEVTRDRNLMTRDPHLNFESDTWLAKKMIKWHVIRNKKDVWHVIRIFSEKWHVIRIKMAKVTRDW